MDEENKTTTPQKKKGGKAVKIIIAIVAVILVIAIVVGVLIATGKLDINLSKKGKMVAGVDQLIESYTAPIDTISKSAEKNDATIKVMDNFSKDSGIAYKTEVSGKIDEVDINSLSSSEQRNVDSIIELINNATLGIEARFDGKESAYVNVNGKIDDTEISGEAVYDGEKVGLRSEELNQKWLTLSNKDIEDAMDSSDVDMNQIKETINTTMEQLEEVLKSANVDEKTQKEIKEKYKDVLKDYINDKAKDIQSEKAKITVDGKDKSCQKLTIDLKEKDLKKILVKYIDTFKDDEKTQKIIKDSLESMAKISEDLDSSDMTSEFENLLNSLDDVKNEINDADLGVSLKLTVYATNTRIYRTDVEIKSEDTTIALATTFNKDETVTAVKVKSSGISMDIGTITITEKDNEVSMKIETSKDLNQNIGVDELSIEITSKIEKSKSEAKIIVKAGSYGEGTITITSDVNKNEEKEYDGTTKINVDVNAPSVATIKGELNIKSNIKVSGIEIPEISSTDSIDMTDQTALQAYVTEAQEKYNELAKKLSENKTIQKILEEAKDMVDTEVKNLPTSIESDLTSDNTTDTLDTDDTEDDSDDMNTVDFGF